MMQIFQWCVSNWMLLTGISVGLYALVCILEKCLTKTKSKPVNKVTVKDADVEDVQV